MAASQANPELGSMSVNKDDYPYGVQDFKDWFPPGPRTQWMAFCNPGKQVELDKKRQELWRKYLDDEKKDQAQRAGNERREQAELQRIRDINRRGPSSSLTAEERKFVVSSGLNLSKADTKKRKRNAMRPGNTAAQMSPPCDTAELSRLTFDAAAAAAAATAVSPEATTASPDDSTNAITQPPTPAAEAAEMDATLAAIEAEYAGQPNKKPKKEGKGFDYWAAKKLDYEPKARPARGGKKAKRKRERQQAADRAARRAGPFNWKAVFNIKRFSNTREFIPQAMDVPRLDEWMQVLHSFHGGASPEPDTDTKIPYTDMFAPPAEFNITGGENDSYNGNGETTYQGEKDFGKRLMENLGWQQGQGLGAEGNEGITNALYVAKRKGGFGVIKGGSKA